MSDNTQSPNSSPTDADARRARDEADRLMIPANRAIGYLRSHGGPSGKALEEISETFDAVLRLNGELLSDLAAMEARAVRAEGERDAALKGALGEVVFNDIAIGSLKIRREHLGMAVRDEWVRWAKKQPNPKPSWLVPWEGLPESDKEVDRLIGSRLYRAGIGISQREIIQERYAAKVKLEAAEARVARLEAVLALTQQRESEMAVAGARLQNRINDEMALLAIVQPHLDGELRPNDDLALIREVVAFLTTDPASGEVRPKASRGTGDLEIPPFLKRLAEDDRSRHPPPYRDDCEGREGSREGAEEDETFVEGDEG